MVLIEEQASKEPGELARLVADTGITVWYSAPSILSLLAQYGQLDARDYSALRLVLFAGEVFPVAHLRALTRLWPHPRYFNLYGPTETNVCTFYEVPLPIAEDRTEPMPIGTRLRAARGVVIDSDGRPVAAGEAGELCIRGPNVTRGYWNLPEQSAQVLRDGRRAVGLLPHRRPRARGAGRQLALPRPPRPDDQEARLPGRARRDRGLPLPPPGGPRGGSRRAARRGGRA